MKEFIESVGGLWPFIRGIIYIIVIIGSIAMLIPIIKDLRENDGHHYD